MNLIIEGSDAVGKSTMAKLLSDELNMLVLQGSSFENATRSNEELYLHFKKVANLDNAIIDRSIHSNQVYATLYKDYTILTDEQRHTIEDKMKQNKDIIVYLTAPKHVIIERLNERGDEYVTEYMIEPILDGYKEAMREVVSNGLSVLSYDTSQFSPEDIVESIIEMIEVSKGKSTTKEE